MEQEIFKKVQETLCAALGVEEGDIRPEASLSRDLGAESIDFIDIIFRLEKSFDIKIPSGELFPATLFNDERFVQQGRVTPAGLEELHRRVPYMDVDGFSKDPQISKMGDFFTVQMVVSYLGNRLAKHNKI
ncbi:MAG: acyl carrier protein [Candidatus Omnitrophica bacterium]|nr:acyl carrier protein [Candidatus Omnitrophota bacterium]